MLDLKPSHKPIKEYFEELASFAQHGQVNEMTVRNAFQDVLQIYTKKLGWQFVEEYTIKRSGRRNASVDGALLDQFSLPRGFWEAKDTQDDLAIEVQKKFADGYPQSNILFWQPGRAILYQDGRKVLDEDISSAPKLVEVLKAFFEYDQPHIKEWEHAVEEFKNTIPTLAESVLRILNEQRRTNRAFQTAFDGFMGLVQQSINPSLSVEAVEEMLIQHLLTRRIFTSIFNATDFLSKNAVAYELEQVIITLVQGYGVSVDDFLKPLDRFYKALELAAGATDDYSQKQTFLNHVYEKFFQGFAVKVADTHGIVYTPQPIVDFMVKSVEAALQRDFNKSLAHEDVHILDPFVGTGNFILRVIREIHAQNPAALRNKYLNELHCNEVMLLPYYIACLNIEHLYFELTGEYLPFPGICLVDTFELVEDRQMGMFTSDNTDRVQRQKDAPIYVVIGNPPYNAGQVNENDNNKNRKYPAIDKRVEETYSRDSKATLRNALADPYVKAFRMASDRVLSRGEGVVCFVTNNGFLDGIAFDGMRKHLRKDFDRISIIDLGGNVRKNPKLSGSTHNVFGIQVGVNITLMEHHADRADGYVRYARMDEFWTRHQKYHELERLVDASYCEYSDVTDNAKNLWLTEGMADDWDEMIPLGSKEGKSGQASVLFSTYSRGVITNGDAYCWNFSRAALSVQAQTMNDDYNRQRATWIGLGSPKDVESTVIVDETKLKWIRNTKRALARGLMPGNIHTSLRQGLYRPFTNQAYFFEKVFNEDRYQFPRIFPLPETENLVVCLSAIGQSKPFHALAVDVIPDLHLTGDSQCFPLYTYDEDGTNRKDNITDWGLGQFQTHYKDTSITKMDIFHYVYGILHDPAYRAKYAANLKRELPRIPFAESFWKVAETGKRLMDIHVHYEDQPEYPLTELWSLPKGYVHPYGLEVTSVDQVPERDRFRVTKMKRDKKDPTRLIVNDFLTLAGIPENVDEYKLGNRSALDWIIDQYQVSTDKRSGITNDPNREDDPTYIIRLIKKVVTVSVETVGLVGENY
ncbi:MAG: DNA helicase [Candidatus Kapabacteria bacterium]|nr:DNA helicase [Candidatus Kapabacteria bacterium]